MLPYIYIYTYVAKRQGFTYQLQRPDVCGQKERLTKPWCVLPLVLSSPRLPSVPRHSCSRTEQDVNYLHSSSQRSSYRRLLGEANVLGVDIKGHRVGF